MIERRTLLLGLVLLAACAKQPPPEKRYTLTGDVVAVDRLEAQARVDYAAAGVAMPRGLR